MRIIAAAVLLGLFTGCSLIVREKLEGKKAADAFVPVDSTPRPPPVQELDILFVVDNSNGMAWAQKRMVEDFPALIDALRRPELGPVGAGAVCNDSNRSGCQIPDLHIGVISTDLGAGPYSLATCEKAAGDGGRLLATPGVAPGCPTPKDAWISYSTRPTVTSNVQRARSQDPIEQVKEAFACIAPRGVGGCGFEQPLESARRALEGCSFTNNSKCKTNPGFVRPDALLAVLWITDEDDCSVQRPELFNPDEAVLGPLNSFRCFEHGIKCDEAARSLGLHHNCHPDFDYLFPVDEYVGFFHGLKPPGRLVLGALTGPPEPVEVGLDGPGWTLKPTCNLVLVKAGAGPAIRMGAMISSYGEGAFINAGITGDPPGPVEIDICRPDYRPAFRALGHHLNNAPR